MTGSSCEGDSPSHSWHEEGLLARVSLEIELQSSRPERLVSECHHELSCRYDWKSKSQSRV